MANFDQEFEDEILAQCLRNTDYVKTASSTLNAHDFCSEQHAWLWGQISDVWQNCGELLPTSLVLRRARADFKDEDERAAVLELSSKLFRLKPTAPRAALSELSDFVRFVKLQTSLEDAVRQMEKGKVDDAYKTVYRTVSFDARPTGYEVARWIEEIPDRLKESKRRKDNPNLYPAIPTGIKGLDKVIQGIRLKEFGLIGATTNRGKSVMAVHLGFHSIIHQYGVVHFSTEMHHSLVAMRYDSRWSRILHSKFKLFDFTRRELAALATRIKKARAKYAGLLRIVSMPVTAGRIQHMRRVVEELRDEMRNLKLVILDSADHIRAEAPQRERRHEIGDVFWELAGWAQEDDLALWATTQLAARAAGRVGTSEDVADNYDKARIAGIIATLNKPVSKSRATPKIAIGDDDDEDGDKKRVEAKGLSTDLELFLSKYRDGAAEIRVPLQTDLKRMLIQDRDDDD